MIIKVSDHSQQYNEIRTLLLQPRSLSTELNSVYSSTIVGALANISHLLLFSFLKSPPQHNNQQKL
jgi:hypothetical protein